MASSPGHALRILLIGNGGREHALAWKLNQSHRVESIYIAPGNGGTAKGLSKVTNVPNIQPSNFAGLVSFAKEHHINMVIPGPEQPLVDGIVDFMRAALPGHVRFFGPEKAASELEGSKAFAKDFMKRHHIPTAKYQNFKSYDDAKTYIDTVDHEIVIKATGLAAGKGVILPASKDEAHAALKDMMLDKTFGSAGDEVVIEERLEGEEISMLSFCDGHTIKSLPPAQDHKQVYDGDQGPNTGGMGCYGPTSIASPQLLEDIHRSVLQPTIDGLRKERCCFVGLLFTGFMVTKDGFKVLEYNVRFGDPETQTLLPLMAADLAEVIVACTDGRLDTVDVSVRPDFAATVVAAAGGYPNTYSKGDEIVVDDLASDLIFHAGTLISDGKLKTAGGRVIAATSTAHNLEKAVANAYKTMKAIRFQNMHYRKDIAHRAFTHAAKSSGMTNGERGMTYAESGVNIDAGEDFVRQIKKLVATTARPGSSSEIGGFGGAFDLLGAGYKESPIMVPGTDGVGTKLKIAQAMNIHHTIGIDLVAMNANDIVACGAEPLYMTDVLSWNTLDVDTAVEVIKGIVAGAREAGCALVGGETAEIGDLIKAGEYDVNGDVTGAIRRDKTVLPDKNSMQAGDVLLGLASSGCHSNGFSLIRKIVEKAGLTYEDPAPWDTSKSIGGSLLTPTRIYVKSVLKAVEKDLIKGMAHITGGGLVENIPRMLPKHLAAHVDASTWPVPKVELWLKKAGKVDDHEFSRVFNTGLGMVMVVAEENVEQTMSILQKAGETVFTVGDLRERSGEGCVVTGTESWK